MKLGGNNVEIAEYPTKDNTHLLHKELNKYTKRSYDDSIREIKKQWMME